jgi:hypothetical protein
MKQAYTNRKGQQRFKPVLTETQFQNADENGIGFCLACGKKRTHTEPDARKYECDRCHNHTVYGAAELLLMNLIVLK